MPLLRTLFSLVLAGSALLAGMPAHAQDAGDEVVIVQENVRYDYAQVLAVDPVYQVLRTTRSERVCDGPEQAIKNSLSRVVGAVKGTLGAKPDNAGEAASCRNVPVTRDYRRPIAYDVDYVYKGSKFRTRMARDPGNRLRIRVSVTPQPVAGP